MSIPDPRACSFLLLVLLALASPVDAQVDVHTMSGERAAGWASPNAALEPAGSASTSRGDAALRIEGFAPSATGDIETVRLQIEASQDDHVDDTMSVAASSPGCRDVTASPTSFEPSDRSATYSINLVCSGAWSWEALEDLRIHITGQPQGGLLLLDQPDGAWAVHYVALEVAHVGAVGGTDGASDTPSTAAAPGTTFWASWSWWPIAAGAMMALVVGAVVTRQLQRRPEATKDAVPPDSPGRPQIVLNDLDAALRNDELVQFMNNASHDLASPLTPIRLQLSLLNRVHGESLTDEHKRALEVVKRNVEHMGLLVTDLKDASRLQAGRLDLFPEPMDLAAATRDACESFLAPCEEKGVRLVVEADEHIPVEADPGRLTQVFYNLINNALKFTDEGTIQVSVKDVGDGRAMVAIRDSGIGMTAEDADKLFRPFSQAHDATQRKKGSGLGLFICKGIVESHGGDIWCESQGLGKGSVFAFTLPMADDPAEHHGAS